MIWCERWAIGLGVIAAILLFAMFKILGAEGDPYNALIKVPIGVALLTWAIFRTVDFMLGGYKLRRRQ